MTKIVIETEGKQPITLLCDACVVFAYRNGAASNLFADGQSLDEIESALDHAERAIGEYTGTRPAHSPPN